MIQYLITNDNVLKNRNNFFISQEFKKKKIISYK